jgi:hypothetical protein
MVAMGTSLADRAWGRDSAVYRVSGVLSVVVGWFFTALIAFLVSGLFAFLMHSFGLGVVAVLLAVATIMIYRSFKYHQQVEKDKVSNQFLASQKEVIPYEKAFREISERIAGTIESINEIYFTAIRGLVEEKESTIRKARKDLRELKRSNKLMKNNILSFIRRIDDNNDQASRTYLLIYDLEQDIIQSTTFVVDACMDHVRNLHSPLTHIQLDKLQELADQQDAYFKLVGETLIDPSTERYPEISEAKKKLFDSISELLNYQVDGVKEHSFNSKNSHLFFSVLLETKDLVAIASRFYGQVKNSF